MYTKILLLERHLTIEYDFVNEWIYANWKGDQNLLTVQDGCEKILQYLTEQRCEKVLNDNRQVTSTWADAAKWVGEDWMPRMATAGLKYFAWVYSPNHFSKLSTDLALSVNKKVIAISFNEIETAKSWLMKM